MIRAVVLLLERDGEVIFLKRSPIRKSLPNRWSLTSGKIEPGESPKDTATREAKEELGVTVTSAKVIDEQHIKKDSEEKILYFIRANYEGTPKILEPTGLTEMLTCPLKDFFAKYSDEEIGHGLQYLRKKFRYQKPSG